MTRKQNMQKTDIGCDGDTIDVVVDLGQVPEKGRALLLETLLAADEGMACRYKIWPGKSRLRADVQTNLMELLIRKQAEVLLDLPGIEFPQLLVHQDLTDSVPEDAKFRTMAKKSWHHANLSILHAIEQYEEFVYLTPASIPLRHGWLATLVKAGRNGKHPVFSEHRKLLVNGAYRSCGWAMSGWFDGKRLRKLPLRSAFSTRIDNPWKSLGDFQHQRGGPGFCLAGDWLSGFDVPMDYLLFALFFMHSQKQESPLAWAAACDDSDTTLIMNEAQDKPTDGQPFTPAEDTVLVLSRDGERFYQQSSLRELYQNSARDRVMAGSSPLDESSLRLKQSGPYWNTLGRNRIRFGIEDLNGLFTGERCFIIGNGPSLKNTDLSLLQNEYTIGLNRIYLNYANMGFQPSFICVTNPNVIEQFHTEIDALDSIKFLTYRCRDLIQNRWNTYFMESRGLHDFYQDLSDLIWCEGCTVTYCAMQVAFYLGFETVVLVGVDHSFSNSGAAHKLVTATGPDQNHFHPDYFGKGVKWQYPDLPASEVSYRVAKAVYEQHGRRILDATVNGQLRVFPRVDYAAYLAGED